MTIRARLTLAVVVLVVAATGGLGFVVVGAARQSMIDRLDERLLEAVDRPFQDGFGGFGPGGPGGGGGDGGFGGGPADVRSIAQVVLDADGEVVQANPAGFADDPDALPEVPDVGSPAFAALTEGIVTLPAEGGDGEVRATARTYPRLGGTVVLAVSMDDVEETTRGLRRTYLLTVVLVAAAGAGVAWWVVRRGLRPIDSMIETAGAIAGGDLTRRVDHPDDGTELGRLGGALDEMLTRLEAAFAEREASEERLKRFAADASHELRTPLTAIRGYAELYRKGGLSAEDALARAMERIEGESSRMGRLVEDLLLLARLDQQRPLERTPVDLRRLVLDAAADHRAQDATRPVRVDADEAVVVLGDEASLRQVLGNLLANVRVHTPEHTPVHLTLRTDGPGWAVLEVRDEGPGIPPEHLDKVFERFNRGDPSRARATGGSGLGLSIVAGLVAAHGGTAAASNAPGDGAVLTLRLPTA